jgi:hypothetical protein
MRNYTRRNADLLNSVPLRTHGFNSFGSKVVQALSGSVVRSSTASGLRSGAILEQFVPIHEAIAAAIRELAPAVKPWTYLATLLGLKEKTARNRLTRSRKFSADEIALLLRSDDGRYFLTTLMGNARPRWYVRMLRLAAIEDALVQEQAANELLRGAIDAVDGLESAIERARLTLAIQSTHEHRLGSDVDREGDNGDPGSMAHTGGA